MWRNVWEKVETFESRIDGLDARVEALEKVYGSNLGAGSRDGSFCPTYVELKGFCEYKDRREKGVSDKQAERFVEVIFFYFFFLATSVLFYFEICHGDY